MEKKFSILQGLKLKGGNMYKKVLSVLVVCSFMISNVCFAMPAVAPALNSSVKSTVDNIARESVLDSSLPEAERLSKVAEMDAMFNSLTDVKFTEVKKLWAKIKNENGIEAKAEAIRVGLIPLDDKVWQINLEDGTSRYLTTNDQTGAVEISENRPQGYVAKGSDEDLKAMTEEALLTEKPVSAERKTAESAKLSDVLAKARNTSAEIQLSKVWDGNGKETVRLDEILGKIQANFDRLGMGTINTQAKDKDTFLNSLSLVNRILIGNRMEDVSTDLIIHEILENMGFEHADILKIQAAIHGIDVANRKTEGEMAKTLKAIQDRKSADIKEANEPANKITKNMGEEIADTKQADKSSEEVAVDISENAVKAVLGNEAITASKVAATDIGVAAVKASRVSLLNTGSLKRLADEEDVEKVAAMLQWISALEDVNAEIPLLEAKMFATLDNAGEIDLTNLAATLIDRMQGIKLKEGAVIHVFSAGAHYAELQKRINLLLGREDWQGNPIFKFHEGDEGTVSFTDNVTMNRVHVMHTDSTKQDKNNQKLAGANYHFINVDIEAINGLALLSAILQGKKTDAINKVLADIAAGELDLLPAAFVLSDEMRFKVEVVKALLQKA
ncbi:MAG: hypothetical protein L6416_04270 [Candidatus Omnitrophica bacterium]|nr:hypothetical protein [Candidatus Omnitrophota bacterium]